MLWMLSKNTKNRIVLLIQEKNANKSQQSVDNTRNPSVYLALTSVTKHRY